VVVGIAMGIPLSIKSAARCSSPSACTVETTFAILSVASSRHRRQDHPKQGLNDAQKHGGERGFERLRLNASGSVSLFIAGGFCATKWAAEFWTIPGFETVGRGGPLVFVALAAYLIRVAVESRPPG
jgi:hypothetical protein